ncbi:MAG: hypothetical protein ACI92B_002286, partial [Marinobacter maritimus]
ETKHAEVAEKRTFGSWSMSELAFAQAILNGSKSITV